MEGGRIAVGELYCLLEEEDSIVQTLRSYLTSTANFKDKPPTMQRI